MTLEIPKTRVRLQPYINVRAIPYDTLDSLPEFDFNNPSNIVMAVQKVTIDNKRPVDFYRELSVANYVDPTAKPIAETYPGLPTYDLSLERVILYESNLIEALGFKLGGHDVFQQWKPLLMAFSLFQPGLNNNSASTFKTYIYHGCWLKNNPLDFDITQDDMKMIQKIDIVAAGVRQV